MRIARALLVATLLLAGAVTAQATPTDPQIIIKAGGLSVQLTSLTFPTLTYTASATTLAPHCFLGTTNGLPSMTCEFANVTGQTIFSLTGFINPGGQLPLTLSSDIFGQTSQTVTGGAVTFTLGSIPDCNLSGGNPACEFSIIFVGFTDPTTFDFTANVPEPGTIAMFLTGLAALAAGRRLRKAGHNA